jgi:ribosome maturation factor RimP
MDTTKIREIVLEVLKDYPQLFLIECLLKGQKGNHKLKILIDGDQGVSIDQCAEISRKIGTQLEEKDWLDSKYILEVSSPGVDFPLVNSRQYPQHVGRRLKVKLMDGRLLEGKLKSVEEDKIRLVENSDKNEQITDLDYSEIEKTNVLVSFK